ncbi:hypothetical protein FSP39_023023 [Pinctada imbricata]|uniref:Uncharacterized protein n=1 Tax=Pinctada imbricata TaxID=66713 RepID=A0AA88Y8M5_PINIB|nr:hypothetical protein FSP39_023023 [Pinctada imbricata]
MFVAYSSISKALGLNLEGMLEAHSFTSEALVLNLEDGKSTRRPVKNVVSSQKANEVKLKPKTQDPREEETDSVRRSKRVKHQKEADATKRLKQMPDQEILTTVSQTADHIQVKDAVRRKSNRIQEKRMESQNRDCMQVKDTARTKTNYFQVKDTVRKNMDSVKVKDAARKRLERMKVKDNVRRKMKDIKGNSTKSQNKDHIQVKDTVRENKGHIQVKDNVRKNVDCIQVKDAGRQNMDCTQVKHTTSQKIHCIEVRDTVGQKIKDILGNGTDSQNKDHILVKDTVRKNMDSTQVKDTATLNTDHMQVKGTVRQSMKDIQGNGTDCQNKGHIQVKDTDCENIDHFQVKDTESQIEDHIQDKDTVSLYVSNIQANNTMGQCSYKMEDTFGPGESQLTEQVTQHSDFDHSKVSETIDSVISHYIDTMRENPPQVKKKAFLSRLYFDPNGRYRPIVHCTPDIKDSTIESIEIAGSNDTTGQKSSTGELKFIIKMRSSIENVEKGMEKGNGEGIDKGRPSVNEFTQIGEGVFNCYSDDTHADFIRRTISPAVFFVSSFEVTGCYGMKESTTHTDDCYRIENSLQMQTYDTDTTESDVEDSFPNNPRYKVTSRYRMKESHQESTSHTDARYRKNDHFQMQTSDTDTGESDIEDPFSVKPEINQARYMHDHIAVYTENVEGVWYPLNEHSYCKHVMLEETAHGSIGRRGSTNANHQSEFDSVSREINSIENEDTDARNEIKIEINNEESDEIEMEIDNAEEGNISIEPVTSEYHDGIKDAVTIAENGDGNISIEPVTSEYHDGIKDAVAITENGDGIYRMRLAHDAEKKEFYVLENKDGDALENIKIEINNEESAEIKMEIDDAEEGNISIEPVTSEYHDGIKDAVTIAENGDGNISIEPVTSEYHDGIKDAVAITENGEGIISIEPITSEYHDGIKDAVTIAENGDGIYRMRLAHDAEIKEFYVLENKDGDALENIKIEINNDEDSEMEIDSEEEDTSYVEQLTKKHHGKIDEVIHLVEDRNGMRLSHVEKENEIDDVEEDTGNVEQMTDFQHDGFKEAEIDDVEEGNNEQITIEHDDEIIKAIHIAEGRNGSDWTRLSHVGNKKEMDDIAEGNNEQITIEHHDEIIEAIIIAEEGNDVPGPLNRFGRVPGPLNRFGRVPGPLNRFGRVPGPLNRFGRVPGPLNRFGRVPGPLNRFGRVPGPLNRFGRVPGPLNRFGRVPGPLNRFGRVPGPLNRFGRVPGPLNRFGRVPEP